MSQAPSAPQTTAAPLDTTTRLKLSVMMFLQYAIWGAWLPVFFSFLTEYRYFTGAQAGKLFGVAAIGALVAPFLAGQIADRFFNTEKFLGISHILGAILVWFLATISDYYSLMLFGVAYSLIYVPTLSLTNALAFHHLPDRDRDFGKVRVWGTIGWIVVGISVGQYLYHAQTPSRETAVRQLVDEHLFTADEATRHAEEFESGRPREADKDFAAFKVQLKQHVAADAQKKETASDESLPVRLGRKLKDFFSITADGRLQEDRDALHMTELANSRQADEAAASELVASENYTRQASNEYLERSRFESAITKVQRKSQVSGMSVAFKLSSILGLILGLFCFVLPATPPTKGQSKFAAGEAMREIVKQPLITLFLIAFPIACIHQFYFVRTEGYLGHLLEQQGNSASLDIGPAFRTIFGVGGGPMTIGQISELIVLATMPFFAKRLSRKSLLSIGLLAYIARFAVFAYLPFPSAVYPALALHGVCFGFFFFVAFMVIDENTTSDVRASAQSLFGLIIFGLGVIAGNLAAGAVDDIVKVGSEVNFQTLFALPMWVGVGCLALLLLLYPGGRRQRTAN